MKEVEAVFPEEEASAGGGLAEKYAAFMEDANEDWVDLITVNLINLRGAVDPLRILAYGLKVDFVVSANLNVAIGMTFQYENFKRHSFSLSVKSKKADSKTIDLSTNGYQFDFYVMSSIGIRAGIRAKATVGLFSTKLAGSEILNEYYILKPFSEVPAALETIKDKKLAILSNGNPEMINAVVKNSKLNELIPNIISVDVLKIFKPFLGVYQLVPAGLSVPREQTLFVSPNSWDAVGAKVFGFNVCWINRTNQQFDELDVKPDIVVKDLKQLVESIKS